MACDVQVAVDVYVLDTVVDHSLIFMVLDCM